MIKAFLFDMNGTLIDDMAYHGETWVQVLAENGVEISAEEFLRRTAGWKNPEILRHLIREDLTDAEVLTLADHKETLYRDVYRPHLKPIDGLVDFLEQVKGMGIKMALATSAPKANIDFVLDGLNLHPYFDAVVGGEDITHGKPHPEIFLTSAHRLGVAPEECIVFEDAHAGIEAARRAGMQVVVITTHAADDHHDAPHILQTAPDFTALDAKEIVNSRSKF
jgi:beta-phosphoglucomutase family hydrolase